MIARPVLTALGCRGCQNALRRAAIAAPTRPYTYATPALTATAPRRLFSTELRDSKAAADAPKTEETDADADDKPWFLEVEPPRHAPSAHKQQLPSPPEDAPALLGPLIQYVHEDMGLDELSLLDLRQLDPPASLGPNLIMILATARSERHLHIASGRFVRWLRRNHGVNARADGLIGAGELKTKLRRLRKKAKLMGTNTAMIPGGDNGISTGWVCVNFTADDDVSAPESATLDESGRISGFGAAQSGTTVVVQCLTEGRREELDLETLWQGILKRSLEKQAQVKGEKVVDGAELDKMLTSKLQVHKTPAKMQWDAMYKASQRRLYSTEARITDGMSAVRNEMAEIQFGGSQLDEARLRTVTQNILQVDSASTPAERLALLDQILLTASERSIDINSRDMLVHLIVSIVNSPAYGEELGRAQKNLEFLLSQKSNQPSNRQTVALMRAYASQKDWDKVWDVFRTPTRFGMSRKPILYETAYELLAENQDRELCRHALRWIYPEMIHEAEKVRVVGRIYSTVKACILVADAEAEATLKGFGGIDGLDDIKHRLRYHEFALMLRHVEKLRQHYNTNISGGP
jgi:hypothetical protein